MIQSLEKPYWLVLEKFEEGPALAKECTTTAGVNQKDGAHAEVVCTCRC